ncbi:Glucoamylase [Streptomyces venezuelae]|uniref:glycoside hydrolase family 15 protein n=1 Tax=Streptomyces gardneri TaxID=66892 RepID=UPI0006BC7272|nr:glycoside hydrolase family 15 protein [Streptomyces gardneri]ALO06542.1 Glucoamylase [Streptomyces venezuelae]QPK43967.1 glycoside hydrolase family 15 protein [Streptomyces gardneri]WRK35233.1 glycoside hydrolase family 15 protein [Streptomyces venezuelae]CUM43184.1 Glucoamylase [Streptomyces venezuelae]
MAGRIEDYALVGDLETAALIGTDGSVDWWCAPRFDSPACLAALLGDPAHGRWLLAPVGKTRCTRRSYRGDTLVLDTFWESVTGTVRVTDFMPPRSPGSAHEDGPRIIRVVEGIAGRVAMRSELGLRFHHGSIVPWTRAVDGSTVASVAGPDAAYFSCGPGVDPTVTPDRTTVEFTVSAGSRIAFVLGWRPSHTGVPPTASPAEIDATLLRTLAFWNDWAASLRYEGPAREAVLRSLLTLKALTYAPTGGIVAAATASLPESIGAQRNWDYRFCWLRDSTFTLSCLLRGGFRREAVAWKDWLLRAVAGDPADLQPLYGVEGQRRLPEVYADWLPGYEGSRPVRFGNAAVDQFQLDIYGEVLNTVYSAVRAGVAVDPPAWALVAELLEYLGTRWREPDEGIWEVRGPRRHFVHSKVMAWVAADRAVRLARVAGLRGSVRRWQALRHEIHAEICTRGWSEEQQSFTQYYGGHQVDATALLIPRLGFLPADDPRVLGTVKAMERLDEHGFLRRYGDVRDGGEHHLDDLGGTEGAFVACTFWYADALAATGRPAEARAVFERVLAIRNDVGLLAEEWDPVARRQLGNTPQALSHVALVNTAFTLYGTRRHGRTATPRLAVA